MNAPAISARRMLAVSQLFSDRDDRSESQVEELIALARGFRTAAKFLFPIPERGVQGCALRNSASRPRQAPQLGLFVGRRAWRGPLHGAGSAARGLRDGGACR